MKEIIFILAFLLHSLFVFSQSTTIYTEQNKKENIKYGINIGVNYVNLLSGNLLQNDISIANKAGFQLGISAQYKITNGIYLAPNAALSFHGSQLIFSELGREDRSHEVMPVTMELMIHFIFKKKTQHLNPYLLIGPNAKIGLAKEFNGESNAVRNSDVALDFGVGFEKVFSRFNFSPELRYSFGFLDVNLYKDVDVLHFHRVALLFNFMGS